MQSVLKLVATFFFGSSALNRAQPQPSPQRWLSGKRPLESLIITNQTFVSVDQLDSPVVSLAASALVISLTSTAPSGNLPSRRYASIASGLVYTLCISKTGLSS